MSVKIGNKEPFVLNNTNYESFDLARTMVSQYALSRLETHESSLTLSTRGGDRHQTSVEAQHSPQVTHSPGQPTHPPTTTVPHVQTQDLSTEQSPTVDFLMERLKEMHGEDFKIEINEAVKDGFGKGIVALVMTRSNRYISEVCREESEAILDVYKKAASSIVQDRSHDCHMDSLTGQPTSTHHIVPSNETTSGDAPRCKNDLQEFSQKRGFPIPSYNTIAKDGHFTTMVSFVYDREGKRDKRRDVHCSDPWSTKRRAEQAAAKAALEWLLSEGHLR